jgi:putative membrane protein
MKRFIAQSIMVGSFAILAACGNTETDSKKEADSTNTAKIDSAKKADSTASTTNTMAEMKPDAKFATAAADGGMLEVELGKMAVEKGKSSTIKKLGAMMVKDHSAANAELTAAAQKKNITLPTAMSDKCQKKVADLSEKSGADFDRAYADLMVSDHKADIDEFKEQAEKGTDADLSQWAKSKIPILEHHLKASEQAQKIVAK